MQCGEWTVERIVDHKDSQVKAKGKKKDKIEVRQYRVRFEGYGEKDDLWYSDDDLRGEGLQAMMEEYDQEQLAKEAQRRQSSLISSAGGAKRSARIAARAAAEDASNSNR